MYPTRSFIQRYFYGNPWLALGVLALLCLVLFLIWYPYFTGMQRESQVMKQSRMLTDEAKKELKDLGGMHQESREFVQP